jgi:hypothetical protein
MPGVIGGGLVSLGIALVVLASELGQRLVDKSMVCFVFVIVDIAFIIYFQIPL